MNCYYYYYYYYYYRVLCFLTVPSEETVLTPACALRALRHDKAAGEKTFFIMKYAWCIQQKICHRRPTLNCFLWSIFYEKWMRCSACESPCSQPNFCLIRRKSKRGVSSRAAPSSLRCTLFPASRMMLNIKWRAEGLFSGTSSFFCLFQSEGNERKTLC